MAFWGLIGALSASSANGEVLLVGNKGEDTLSLVDFATGRECARLATGKAPHEIAVSPDGKLAAIVSYGGASLDIFDIRRQRLVRRIDLGANHGPHGIIWQQRNRIIAVTDRGNSLLAVDPLNGRFQALPTGQRGSHMVEVTRDGTRAYVSNILSGSIGVFDLVRWTKLGDIPVGGNPEGLALSVDGTRLWVGDNSGPRIKVVDLATNAVIATLASDSIALRLAASPDGDSVVASNFVAGTLTVYDARSPRLLRSISVSGERQAMQVTMTWSNRPGRILVAETGRDQIAEVDLLGGRVLRRIAVGRNGDGLALAPGTCRLLN